MNELRRLESVFFAASEIPGPAERSVFLDQACGGDGELRSSVEKMLAARLQAQSFLEEAPVALGEATVLMPAPLVGTRIGPYKLLEQIGEGGMGVVYVAEQTEPIRRRVALKVIKPGMDSRQVVARFAAERQALALMDHPHIATVLDAGVNEAGLPYFVMELVRGLPITEYCDAARLTPDQRIELFIAVCQAVQHAHQKGIIHRDLKPSNVLVTQLDGKPIPKVIDFGVAKAIGPQLSDRSVYTGFLQLVGTPLYMSPEQAELSAADIDTRSDVYSLGVLLYELLTGRTPFDSETLFSGGLDEMRRIIREQEPPRPSHRVSTLQAADVSTVSSRRSLDERRLEAELTGELDWIVMKALEKDRDRRYESASALAADLRRYLADEPVLACPPSTLYRLRKSARRHRGLLATAGLLAATLLVATGVSLTYAIQADNERARAVASEEASQQHLQQSRADFDRALRALDSVVTELTSAEFAQLPGADRLRKDVLARTMAFYQDIIAEHNNDPYAREQQAVAWSRVSDLHSAMKQLPESLDAINRSVEILERLTTEHPDNMDYQKSLMRVLFSRMHNLARSADEQLQDAERAFVIAEKCIPTAAREQLPWFLLFYHKLAARLPFGSPRSRELLDQSLAIAAERGVDPDPGALIGLAKLAEHDGKIAEAERYYRRGIAEFEKIGVSPVKRDSHIERHLATVDLCELGRMLERANRTEDAEACFRQAVQGSAQLCRDYGQIPGYREALASQAADLMRVLTALQREPAAEMVLQDLLKEFSRFQELHNVQADRLRRGADAERLLSDAIGRYPSQPAYYLKRAGLRQANGQLASAIEDVNRALELATLSRCIEEAFARRANILFQQRNFAQAEADLTAAMQYSHSWHYFKRRAACRFELKQFEPALADLREGVRRNPEDLTNLTWIDVTHIRDCPDAPFRQGFRELLDQTVELNQQSLTSLLTRAEVCLVLGDLLQARADFDAALTGPDAGFSVYYPATLLALVSEDVPRYRQLCRELLSKFGDATEPAQAALIVWACCLAPGALDDYAPALKLAEQAVAAETPAGRRPLTTHGAVLLRSGNAEQALKVLEEAAARPASPQTSPAYAVYLQALALQQLGRLDEARTQLEQASGLAAEELENTQTPPGWIRAHILKLLRAEAEQMLGITTQPSPERPPDGGASQASLPAE